MQISRRTVLASIAGVAAFSAVPSFADATGATVTVSLWDKGDTTDLATGLGHGLGGDMSKATMGVTATPTSVKAGEVTFVAVNDSKGTVHEMIVAPLKTPDEVLPYDKGEDRVMEDAAGHLGEVSELDPGASGKLTLTLKPGDYILYCNIPGHYMAGMWTGFTVTK